MPTKNIWRASPRVLLLLSGIAGALSLGAESAGAAEPEPPPVGSAAPPAKTQDAKDAAKAQDANDTAKAQDAKDTAKAAALTPIVASGKDQRRPAFQLYAEVDLPILGVGLVAAGARLVRVQKAFCAPLCDPNELNAIDRTTAGWWSSPWATASDFGLYGVIAGAATLLAIDEGPLDALNDAFVVAESALSATAVTSVMSIASGRPRPFMYGTNAPEADRNSADGSLSFVSSHAAVSYAVATSLYITEHRLHPNSDMPLVVLVVGETAATFVATARVMAGKHFITDSVSGAVVGISMGMLVPSLHQSPLKIVPVVSATEAGLGAMGTF